MKNFKAAKTLLFVILFSALPGCFPQTQRVVVAPPSQGMEAPLSPPLPLETLQEKIGNIQQKLDADTLNDDERDYALELMKAYQEIMELLKEGPDKADNVRIIRLLFSNLSRVDERYFATLAENKQKGAEAMRLFSSKRKKIMDSYLYENYQGVIDECLDLEAAFGPESLTPEIGLVFSIALSKKGMFQEALNIGEKILSELDLRPDALFLKSRIIEWHLALGEREKAFRAYEKMVDSLDEKANLLKKAEKAIASNRLPSTEPPPPPQEGRPLKELANQHTGDMERLLLEVDRLVQDRAYQDAKILLIRERIKYKEGTETETIDQALKSVEIAEKAWGAHDQTEADMRAGEVNSAKKLMDDEKYEEALLKLEGLEKDPASGADVGQLKNLAIEKIVNRERNRAAQLFLKAKNTKDPKQRKTYLTSSLNILKNLIEKYPSSPLIKRINSHLSKVEEALNQND